MHRSHLKFILYYMAGTVLIAASNSLHAQTRVIHASGKTLIEAEAYSATSKEYPQTETCSKCSGGKNVGFFWKDSWFEIEVQIPSDSRFALTARASSEAGANVAVLLADGKGGFEELGQLVVPQTRNWQNYTITKPIPVSLAQGTHTLRFRSLTEGANIDYFTFDAASQSASNSIVTYRPAKNAGPDKNPMKGFGSGWWRPDEDYATVGFQYIEWGRLEPEDDRFDWNYVEEVLDRAGTRGRHLILQFVVDWDYREPVEANYLGPKWLLDRVGEYRGHADPNDATSRLMRATKYNDPIYVDEATEAITVLTDYFQDDPRVFVLQAGLLGLWSEWHTFPREDWSPNDKTKQALLNVYLKNLPERAYTQIRFPDEPGIQPRPGIGYSNGSATPTDHGYEFGQAIERKQLWKNGPITGEWPPNVEADYWKRFFQSGEGLEFIQQGRYSTLLMPEFKDIQKMLPSWQPDELFKAMHRSMGYNLQVEKLRYAVTDSQIAHFELTLANVGMAPFYMDWDTQLALLEDDGRVFELVPVETDLRKLRPDETVVLKCQTTQSVDVNAGMQIGLRIVQPGADQPKRDAWKLDARNSYVVIANEVDVIEGDWDAKNALRGGWNLLGPLSAVQRPKEIDYTSFPFHGSYRPTK